MWLIFPVVVLLAAVNTVVLLKLKARYPEIYQEAGSPVPLCNGFSQWSFSLGFIGLRQFSEYTLDENTRLWCNIYFWLNWLSLAGLFVGATFWIAG